MISLSILVVEDHTNTARSICEYLRKLGHQVRSAATFADANEQLSQHPSFDLLMADVGLPDGDGCELLRKASLPLEVYAVAISAFSAEAESVRVTEAGFHQHLHKPFGFEQLEAVLDRAIDHRRRFVAPLPVK